MTYWLYLHPDFGYQYTLRSSFDPALGELVTSRPFLEWDDFRELLLASRQSCFTYEYCKQKERSRS